MSDLNAAARFLEGVQASVEAMLGEVNTAMPGRIVSYDAARNRAVVQPALPKRLADGSTLLPPAIHEVPVLWPSAGGAVLTLPLRAGDEVWLEFAQRSLEGWLSGNDSAPDDPRQFDLTDCVARPGGGRDVAEVDADAVVLRLGGLALRLEPGGTARLTGDLIVEGTLRASTDVLAGAVSLKTHRHTETGSGGGTTTGPIA